MNPINSFILTDITKNFIKYLIVIPENLKMSSVAMLILLLTLDLMLIGKKLIADENFNPIKYLINKTWQFSYLIFVILNYSWLIGSLREGFKKLAALATGITINSAYINDPSGIIDLGTEFAWGVVEKGVGLNPISWSYLLIALLILIAFCMIGFGLVMTWIEYYFLIGISIIFVPFGILDTTEGYYKNIFKTIIGCNIKLFVLEFWLLLCEPIIKNLQVSNKMIDFYNIVPVSITLLVLGLILLSLPRLASSILTGSPAMSAGAAMSSAVGGFAMATRNLSKAFGTAQNVAGGALQTGGEGVKETAQGTLQGAKTGGNIGARLGSVLGPVGSALGGTIGTAAGATVGGAYSGAKFAAKTTGNAVKKAFGIKSNSGVDNGSGKQEAVKNNIAAAKSPAKETPAGSNSGVKATTGEARNNGSSAKEAEQGDTSTVSSVDTGESRKETSNVSESDPGTKINKSTDTISTGESRKGVSGTSSEEKKSSESQNVTSSSNTTVETKTDTGEVRQGAAEAKQNIGEIKEPKYNFDDIKGTTKVNGVEINDKKKK